MKQYQAIVFVGLIVLFLGSFLQPTYTQITSVRGASVNSSNLLSNPGFEENFTSWLWYPNSGSCSKAIYSDGNSHGGLKHLATARNSTYPNCNSVYQDKFLIPQTGDKFTYGVWLRSPWTPQTVPIALWFTGPGGGEYQVGSQAYIDNTWRCFQMTLTINQIGQNNRLRTEIYLPNLGPDVNIDDVYLGYGQVQYCPLPPIPTPTPFPTTIPAPIPTPPPNSCVMPFFSQVNGQWKNHPLRSSGACSSYCGTIGNCGCTLTSAAMIYKFYGATTTSQNKEMNPKNLSDCMWTKACPFDWLKGQTCGRNKTTYWGQVGFSWNSLSQEINQNKRPVILYLRKGTRTHWVVVFRGSGSNPADYRINDPAMLAGANIKLSTRTGTGWTPYRIARFSGPFTCGNIVADTSFIDPDSWQPAALQTTTSTTTPADTPLNLTPALTTTSPITGNIWIYTASDITMTLQLTATSSEADITDMVVWTDTITNTTWQPFSEYIWLPVSETVYVRYRDANSNVSDVFIAYLDPGGPPEPIEPLNLFLPYISSE